MTVKIVISGILFLFVLATGIWMSKLGKPYNQVLFNIHKLISLAAIVLSVIAFINYRNQVNSTNLVHIIAYSIAFILFTTIVTGGILNAKKETINLVLMAHKIGSILSIVSSIAFFALLLKFSK